MKKIRLILVLLLAGGVTMGKAEALTLVKNGKAKVAIGYAADSPKAVRASLVLENYLEQMTGADFERVACQTNSWPEGKMLLVGCWPGKWKPEPTTAEFAEERYFIRPVGDQVFVTGNDTPPYNGTVYAAYDFLRQLGCRWYFPGKAWTVVPKKRTLVYDGRTRVESPMFRLRDIWYSGWRPISERDGVEFREWYEANRLTYLGIGFPSDGTIGYFLEGASEEALALTEKGERDKTLPCMTSPEAEATVAENVADAYSRWTSGKIIGFSPPDGYPVCNCPKCQAKLKGDKASLACPDTKSISDLWFSFFKRTARRIKRLMPDRVVATLAYANRVRPPKMLSLGDNTMIQFAHIWSCNLHSANNPYSHCSTRHEYLKFLTEWCEICPRVYLREYDPGVSFLAPPVLGFRKMADEFQIWENLGLWGFYTEGQNTWLQAGWSYYLRSVMMWEGDVDWEKEIKQMCKDLYGRHGETVFTYLDQLDRAVYYGREHGFWSKPVRWDLVLTDAVVDRLCWMDEKVPSEDLDPEVEFRLTAFHAMHGYILGIHHLFEGIHSNNFELARIGLGEIDDSRIMVKADPKLLPAMAETYMMHSTGLEWYRRMVGLLAEVKEQPIRPFGPEDAGERPQGGDAEVSD